MDLRVTIDHNLPQILNEPVVAYGDFRGAHAGLTIYSPGTGASPLSRLYVDLICGRPLALTFVTRAVSNLETVVAAALFLDRELCLHPQARALVSAVELVTQLQEGGLAHVERDLARLFVHIDGYLVATPTFAKKAEKADRLGLMIGWLRDYLLRGVLPGLWPESEPPKVIDRGTNGFVLAEVPYRPIARMVDAVIELYRQGHLRGVVFSKGEKEHVLAFRKSPYVRFDLAEAEARLNGVETHQGHPASWKLKRFLLSSSSGTLLPRQFLIETFLRV